jgi:poly(A) polymerase
MIMVAIICKMFPNLEPNQLLYCFFGYYLKWDWNYRNPLMLVPVSHEIKYNLNVDLFYRENEKHIMPVLTPAYPAMNSTHNVCDSTKEAILTEFEKAFKLVEALIKRDEVTKLKAHPSLSWTRLFKRFHFFSAYQHFIQVTALAVDADHHKDWEGFVESKIRHFVQRELESLRRIKSSNICLDFRPWPTPYEIQSTMTGESATGL